MAKLLNIKKENAKKENVAMGIAVIVCIAAIIFSAFVHQESEKGTVDQDATQNDICVHVKGAVENPGLYYVPYGTRVNDLGEYAGGFLLNADTDGVNLARYVDDGEEIYIPYKGSAETGGYNLNTVTVDELVDNIDGIGETYAEKIVNYRESHGKFTNVNELKMILSQSVYEKVRERFYAE